MLARIISPSSLLLALTQYFFSEKKKLGIWERRYNLKCQDFRQKNQILKLNGVWVLTSQQYLSISLSVACINFKVKGECVMYIYMYRYSTTVSIYYGGYDWIPDFGNHK